MPKLKTNRAAAKRFKKTASGRVKRRRAFTRHILTNKTRKQKRRLGTSALVHKADERGIKRLLPYL
jgi:large subunit ribosomal protein L35